MGTRTSIPYSNNLPKTKTVKKARPSFRAFLDHPISVFVRLHAWATCHRSVSHLSDCSLFSASSAYLGWEHKRLGVCCLSSAPGVGFLSGLHVTVSVRAALGQVFFLGVF